MSILTKIDIAEAFSRASRIWIASLRVYGSIQQSSVRSVVMNPVTMGDSTSVSLRTVRGGGLYRFRASIFALFFEAGGVLALRDCGSAAAQPHRRERIRRVLAERGTLEASE